jgi:hypothetical protein
MNAEPQHVIFGTGAVGLVTLDALRRRGETTRLVNRSGTAPVPGDIEVLWRSTLPRWTRPGRHLGHLPHQPSIVSPPDSGRALRKISRLVPRGATSRSRREHHHGFTECNDIRPCERRYGRPRA